jgi:shikimate kinase
MQPVSNQPILLMGFKNVGKSVIGAALAKKLKKPFIDLDQQIEELYIQQENIKRTCDQIIQQHGDPFFRTLETQALRFVLTDQTIINQCAIIALGGGTPIKEENQKLLQQHKNIIIYITAPRAITFDRIMLTGRPAYFNPAKDPLEEFNHIWDEREQVYQKLASFTLENAGQVAEIVDKIINKLKRSLVANAPRDDNADKNGKPL